MANDHANGEAARDKTAMEYRGITCGDMEKPRAGQRIKAAFTGSF